jgi:integrase
MFAWAIEKGYATTNPFVGVKLGSSPANERFLSKAEAGALLDAANELEAEALLSPTFADALRLLLLTGARKTEILGLRWPEVDLERKVLVLPPKRTKAGGKNGTRRISLSTAALALLGRRRAAADAAAEAEKAATANKVAKERKPAEAFEPSEYVFPAARGDGHATGLRKALEAVWARAGLKGVRIHDLRHSFASFAIADGASLFLVSKLLGHASARTTERYAHLSSDPLEEAVNRIARQVAGDDPPEDAPESKGEVIQIRR